jgi:bifunctional non-homologous end joining protein LigD
VFSDAADVLLEACGKHQVEGLVAKRTDSTYQPGKRSRSWVKVKTADWREHHAPKRHERIR